MVPRPLHQQPTATQSPTRPARRFDQLKKQMTSLPPLGASHPRRRRGQLHPFASISNNVDKPLSSHRRNRTATAELDRLGALQMPGVRPESPAPELRRIRTANPAASSKVDSGRARMSVRAKVPVNLKAKGSEDQEKRITNRRGRLVPAERCRSPTPQPPPVGSQVGRRRCSWITANSEPLYVKFHDDEWGVPVHNDQKLFELLTLSQALAEHTWPTILSRREEFREMFDRFNYPSVSEFTDKKINLLRSSGSMLLSEQKIRAVVTNAKQMHKVVQEFGSFSIYCWSFVNHRPITNSFRYARQVPIKTPKAEAISKDLMRRGFQFQACSNVKNVRAEPALSERRLSSSSSEDSDIRET